MDKQNLTKLMAEKVMKKFWKKPTHGPCCTCQTCGWNHDECQCDWDPCDNIADAFLLLEKVKEDKNEKRVQFNSIGKSWSCTIWEYGLEDAYLLADEIEANTPSMAIVLAIEKTLEDK